MDGDDGGGRSMDGDEGDGNDGGGWPMMATVAVDGR
jgi:hypothetical protein